MQPSAYTKVWSQFEVLAKELLVEFLSLKALVFERFIFYCSQRTISVATPVDNAPLGR
jgi:hypothetical protein